MLEGPDIVLLGFPYAAHDLVQVTDLKMRIGHAGAQRERCPVSSLSPLEITGFLERVAVLDPDVR
jgi:hypothetical protein